MAFKDTLAEMGLAMGKTLISAYIAEVLAKFKEHNEADPTLYHDFVRDGNNWLSRLEVLANSTKTRLDDIAVDIFLDPIKAAAAAEGIELTPAQ